MTGVHKYLIDAVVKADKKGKTTTEFEEALIAIEAVEKPPPRINPKETYKQAFERMWFSRSHTLKPLIRP